MNRGWEVCSDVPHFAEIVHFPKVDKAWLVNAQTIFLVNLDKLCYSAVLEWNFQLEIGKCEGMKGVTLCHNLLVKIAHKLFKWQLW